MSRLAIDVDQAAITRNVRRLSEFTTAQVMAVVKADGYGHGLVTVARAAQEGGATWLGVAQWDEALALRQAGIQGRILTWLHGPELPAAAVLEADIDVSAGTPQVLDVIAQAVRDGAPTARVHLSVDSGLAREGATLAQLPSLLEQARAAEDAGLIRVVGMWSHLARADEPGHPSIDLQAENFRAALALAEERGFDIQWRHVANSAAILTRPDLHFDVVRAGIAMYGYPPIPDPDGAWWGLEPAMTVSSTVVALKDVPAGQGVSYGHTYVTQADTTLALVSAGYSDGVFRAGSSVAEVAVRGRRYRIAGRVCMDQFVIDVGRTTDVAVGDPVTLVGPLGPTARDWADAIGTIDYEVLCRFGSFKPKEAR